MDTTLRILPTHAHGNRAPVTRKPGRLPRAILACALFSLALGQAEGRPGDLDPSFDADGLVLTHFGRIDDDSVGGRNDFANAVAVSPDGKLVVAGSSLASGDFNLDFALARYNRDGTPDTSFGSGGRVLTGFPPSEFGSSFDEVVALVVQPDSKPVVAGSGSDAGFVLARYSPDGSLDASFGSNGVVATDFRSGTGDNFDRASALVLQPDGKLVAAGFSNFFDEDDSDFALARFNPDGALDTSFGSSGLVRTDFEDPSLFGDSNFDAASALVLQPDGKLVAAGSSSCGIFPGLAFARYNPDGSLDSTFGSGGLVRVCDNQQPSSVEALVLQPDGKLVTLEESFLFDNIIPSTIFSLLRFNSDGTPDTSFGTGGRVLSSFGSENLIPEALILQSDGKLVVAGATGECFLFVSPGLECPASDFVLVRHNPDGSLDTSFGSGGRVLTNFSGRIDFFTNRAQALVQQPDGKLVAAGISRASGDTDFALARYLVTDERGPRRRPAAAGAGPRCSGPPVTIRCGGPSSAGMSS